MERVDLDNKLNDIVANVREDCKNCTGDEKAERFRQITQRIIDLTYDLKTKKQYSKEFTPVIIEKMKKAFE